MLNFYANPVSLWSCKVHYFLEEAGIPYQMHVVDLRRGEQKRPEFLRINPFGVVPAIEMNGFCLSESAAIVRYLAQRFDKTQWWPRNLEDQAHIDNMVEFCNLHLNRWFAQLGWHSLLAPKLFGTPARQQAIDEAKTNIANNLAKLERHLSRGRTYLSGPVPTLSDITLLPFAATSERCGVILRDSPHVQAWLGRMAARPAWKKVDATFDSVFANAR